MKNTFIISFCFFVTSAFAQKNNIFHDRDFWKQNPEISEIERLIKDGNDITSLNANAFDAVTWALIEKADNETVKYLLSKKGNGVNKLTHDGRTYIFWAAYKGNLEMMQYLVDRGAKTDIIDSHGYSVFNFAANAGQKDKRLYDFLIEHGADPVEEKNHHGANAMLLIAPFLEDFEIVEYFSSLGLNKNSVDNDGNGIFNYAAKGGNISFLKQLVKNGYAYKELNRHGGNAFLMASQGRRGHTNPLEVYTFLESLGLEPDNIGKDGKNPLHNLAYRNKDIAALEYFIQKGVDVNLQDANGQTPFMSAARGNDLNIIQLLLPYVDDINLQNNEGYSALTKAFGRNEVEVVELLLKNDADITVKDKDGNSLAYYLLDTFNDPKEFEAKLNLLMENNIALDAIQAKGNTLLHEAVKRGNLELVKRVTAFGMDINAKNDEGNTALHLAAMKARNQQILKYLISKGADKTLKTHFEETVYDLAAENELLQQNNTDLDFLR
mgnify:CR=1 FL=1